MPLLFCFLSSIKPFGKRYILTGSYRNEYRHYGTYCLEALILNEEEVCYIVNPSFKTRDKGILMYIKMKNNGFNLFRFQDRTDKYFVYKKTKDFNRKTALPDYILEMASKYDCFADKLDFFHPKPHIFCVYNQTQMMFLEVSKECLINSK